MTEDNKEKRVAQWIALGLTALIGGLVVLWLLLAHIHLSDKIPEWPPLHENDVALVEDQFFDVIEDIPMPYESADAPSPVHDDVAENNASVPAPKSGSDMRDNGPAGDAPVAATSPRPSPVKEKTQPPKPVGPSQEELDAKREEEARRKANEAMNSAFNRSTGKDNTANQGKNPGDSGSPGGSATGINGTGTGSVGGGWVMPSYAKVPATVTGTIKYMVKIDGKGNVVSVTFQGGDAPAATDSRLRAAVEKEIRSRRFTRGSSPAPDESTAYITYRFR